MRARLVNLNKEKINYLLVGAWNTAFSYLAFAALYFLLRTVLHYEVLLVVSSILSITNAYIAYKLFVFKTKGHYLREYSRFYVVYGGSLLMNLVLLPVFVVIFGLSPLAAQAGLSVFTVVFSYYGHRNFSFKPAAALAILLLLVSAALGEAIDLSGPAYDWRAAGPQTRVSVEDDIVRVTSAGGWAGVYNQRLAGALLDENNLLSFEMKTSSGGVGAVMWANYLDQRFLPQRGYQFYLGSPGRWHRYYVDLSAYEKDLTRLDNFLINPLTGPGEAEIREIRITRATTAGKLLAGWQEFLGPRGREIAGYTINTMPSPRLFGREIFVYLYWLVGLAAAGLLARELWPVWRQPVKKGKAKGWSVYGPAFERAVKQIVVLVCGLWIALELSSLYTDWRNLRGDLPLFGRSLEEKRALVNAGDFYPFMTFCLEKLPAGAAYDYRVGGMYNDIKTVYYLYPHEAAAGAAFLVVYDQDVSPEVQARYAPFAVFRPNAYIMKRVGS